MTFDGKLIYRIGALVLSCKIQSKINKFEVCTRSYPSCLCQCAAPLISNESKVRQSDPTAQLASCRWCPVIEKFVLPGKYFRYLHQINIAVFTIVSSLTRATKQFSSTIISRISLLEPVVYSSSGPNYWLCRPVEE